MSAAIAEGNERSSYRSNWLWRAGVMGGARTASPRRTKIASTTFGWAIAEMTAALSPHFGQQAVTACMWGQLWGQLKQNEREYRVNPIGYARFVVAVPAIT